MKIWEDERQCYIRAAMEKNSEAENEALKAQLDAIDWSVLEQIERKETVNERGVFAPLEAVETEEIERRRDEFRELGIKAIREGKVGAVLLAGGQGTRLGLDRPKGTLNIGIHRELFLFQQLIRNLMDVTDEAGAYVPLYIMTSNINHDDTQAFFEEHGVLWLPEGVCEVFRAGDGTRLRLSGPGIYGIPHQGCHVPERQWRLVWLHGECRAALRHPFPRD